MDNFCEQLVARKRTNGDIVKAVLIILAFGLVGCALIFFALISGLLLLIVIGMFLIGLGVWLAAGLSVEYEYIVTNNEMDIDKILGKRKRKRMITVDLSTASQFEGLPCDEEKEAEVTVQASTGLREDAFILVCDHKDYGTVKIIFNPNDNTRKAIGQQLPSALRHKVNDNG